MLINNFEDLQVWKASRELTRELYKLSSKEMFFRDYGLRDQLQRASVSIMLNIAEGFDSRSSKSFLVFLSYSYRSTSEVRAILFIALDQNYLTREEFHLLSEKVITIQKMLNNFMKYLKKQ